MKIYNKLVRDKIPEVIESNNQICKVRILNDEEYLEQLNIKLQEELNEYLEDGSVEELADIQEVIYAILKFKKVSFSDFEKIRSEKVAKRGAFDKKIFLENVDEK
ncbi:MAG: nucleoside triphosphate pyrophosphohydrolase [Clostridia bacterium]|nr:nucleoside triphosphate pyrophosphohydrolase [Clostridia bacterium]